MSHFLDNKQPPKLGVFLTGRISQYSISIPFEGACQVLFEIIDIYDHTWWCHSYVEVGPTLWSAACLNTSVKASGYIYLIGRNSKDNPFEITNLENSEIQRSQQEVRPNCFIGFSDPPTNYVGTQSPQSDQHAQCTNNKLLDIIAKQQELNKQSLELTKELTQLLASLVKP